MLLENFALLRLPPSLIPTVSALPQILYIEMPHYISFEILSGKRSSCITQVTLPPLSLTGNGVLVGFVDSGIDLTALKVDGGACANNYLLQTMADISNLPVKRPCCVETTALGAAYLAGLAVGYWSSTEDVLQNWSVDREFMPGIPDDERTRRLKGWNKAVRCSYGWAKEE